MDVQVAHDSTLEQPSPLSRRAALFGGAAALVSAFAAQGLVAAEEATPEVVLDQPPVEIRAKGLGRAAQRQALQYSAPTIDGEAGAGGVAVERPAAQAPALGVGTSSPAPSDARRSASGQAVGGDGPSRNAPCPCGSGRKYKRCHGSPDGGA